MPTSLAFIRKTVAVGPGGTSCHFRLPKTGRRKLRTHYWRRCDGRIAFKLCPAND